MQDEWRASRAADAQRRAALRVPDAAATTRAAATSTLPDLLAPPRPTSAPLYENPTGQNLSPRVGFAWDVLGRRPHGGARRLRPLLQHQQPAEPDRHRDEPAGHAAAGHRRTRPSRSPTSRASGRSRSGPSSGTSRRRACTSGTSTCSASSAGARSRRVGYAGSRGQQPAAQQRRQRARRRRRCADGTLFYPADRRAAEHGLLDDRAEEERRPLLVRRARRSSCARSARRPRLPVLLHLVAQHRHDAGLDLLLRRDERHRVVLPGVRQPDYNKGLADYHATHNWVLNVTWDLPFGKDATGASRARCSAAGRSRRSGRCAAARRSRSSCGPTARARAGRRRSAPARASTGRASRPAARTESAIRGTPEQWFDPTAFVLQPAGTFGNLGRGALIGPGPAHGVDLALVEAASRGRGSARPATSSCASRPSTSSTARTSASRACRPSPASPTASAAADARPHPQTVTSARQIQLGVRVRF